MVVGGRRWEGCGVVVSWGRCGYMMVVVGENR